MTTPEILASIATLQSKYRNEIRPALRAIGRANLDPDLSQMAREFNRLADLGGLAAAADTHTQIKALHAVLANRTEEY